MNNYYHLKIQVIIINNQHISYSHSCNTFNEPMKNGSYWTNYWSGHGRTGQTGDYALACGAPTLNKAD